MAVGIDATWRHVAAGGVDLLSAGRQAEAQLHDAAAGDADVRIEGVAGGGNAGVAHHEIEVAEGHGLSLLFCLSVSGTVANAQAFASNSRPQPFTAPGATPTVFSARQTTVATES
ncbi:hypothetical protein D9M68_699780 [compost metagenome]